MNTVTRTKPRTRLHRHQATPAGHLGQRRLRRRSAPRCRSSARRWPRPPTCAPASACSTSPPATATPRSPPRAASPRSPRPTTCRPCSTRAARAPRAEGLPMQFQRRRRRGTALRRRQLRRRAVDLRRDVHARPRAAPRSEMLRVLRPGGRIGAGELDAGRLHRPPVQGDRRARAAAGRACSRPRCGAPSRTSSSCSARRPRRSAASAGTSTSATARPAHWVQVFRDFYGPTHKAFAALDAAGSAGARARHHRAARRS